MANGSYISSLIRIRTPSALLQVTRTRTHIRNFASEVPPNGTSNLPTLSSGKPRKENVKAGSTSDSQPVPKDIFEREPKPQAQQADPQAFEVPYAEEHPDDKPLRPPHGIKLDPENHGLSAFYRKFWRTDQGRDQSGNWDWTAVEPKDGQGHSGRSWSAPELRRKSFKDLHTLWYVLLREQNLLATQKEELRRLGVENINVTTDLPWKVHQCRKSMARIKYVINERRLAYEGAVERFAKDKELGKIGAVAEQKTGPKKTKGSNPVATAARGQGRSNANRRHTRIRTKSSSGEINIAAATAATPLASPAP